VQDLLGLGFRASDTLGAASGVTSGAALRARLEEAREGALDVTAQLRGLIASCARRASRTWGSPRRSRATCGGSNGTERRAGRASAGSSRSLPRTCQPRRRSASSVPLRRRCTTPCATPGPRRSAHASASARTT
jgi:hypothetical protein